MGNCKAATRGPGGEAAAECISEAREQFQNLLGQSQNKEQADKEANRRGRRAGREGKSCKEACLPLTTGKFREFWDEGYFNN